MKSILAVSLLVGVALCSSTAFYGWAPHKEMTYRFESQILTGIPEIESQYSGLKLASDVRVQTFDDYSLRIKFENPRYVVVNQKLFTHDGRPQVPKPQQELPEPLRQHLSSPFLVHMKRGVVEEMFVEKDEPVVITNIKKALLSQLQMDISGSRKSEVRANQVNKMEQEQSMNEEMINFFSTFESTVLGDCETTYTVNPLPKFQAKEIEEAMRSSEQRLTEEGIIAGERSEGEEACRNKKYWEVVKTKSFDNCKNTPVYQSASGIKLKCDFSKAECSDALTHISSTRYVLCGSSPRDFYIREAITDNNIETNPMGWIASNEKMNSFSRVTLNLLKVKSSGFSPLPKPTNVKQERSLVFQYPKKNLWSDTSVTKALNPEQETNKYGFEQLRPMPDLRSGSSLFPSPLPISELKQEISKKMKEVVSEIFKSPQSCASKSDISGSVSAIASFLHPLSLDHLKEIEHSLHSQSMNPEQREIAQELFLDILAMTATNPAVMLVKEKIERGDLSERVAVKALQSTIRNVKTPTQQLLKELLNLVKSLESRRHIYNIASVQLSNLVNKACIDTDSQTANFPVRIYGLFCKEDSEFVTREYLPYLIQKLHETNKESKRLVLISALGKVGHKDILLPLVKYIEEPRSLSPMGRSIAVYMLKRLAKNEPSMVKPVLLALINNPAETTEVRIAAVSVLPWTQPSTAELQRIATRSWFDPSQQVSSFIYSTLKSVVDTEIPELKSVGQKAKGLLKSVKPAQWGIQFSKNDQSKKFVDYLLAASNVEYGYVNTENSLTPSRVSLSSRLFGNSWEIEGLSFGIYTKGMDSFIEYLWQKIGYENEISEQVKEQLERIGQKLKIKNREEQSPASFIFFGMLGYDRVYSMDKGIYGEIIEKVTEELRNNPDIFTQGKNFNYTHSKYVIDLEAVGPTDSGFAILTNRNVPFVAGIEGNIQAEGKIGARSTVNAKIIPVINAKMQSNMGVISPFTKEFVGVGVEASIHVTVPLKFKSILTRTGLELSLQSPEEIQNQFEVLHAFVKPYTVRKSLETVEPISKSQHAKPILSMRETQKKVNHIGQNIGIKGLLTMETDYPTPYFSNVWNMVKKHNMFSLTSLAFPASVRYSSFKLEYNPSQSQTKEIETAINIVYGVQDEYSGPMIHYPTQEEVTRDNEMEITQLCKDRHPNSRQQEVLCKEQLRQRNANKKEVHQRAIRLLEQSSSGTVSGLSLESSLKTESSHRTLNTFVLVNGQRQGNQIQGKAELSFKTPSGPKYEVQVEGELELPKNKFRWNVESMIDQPMSYRNKFVARYGRKGENKQEMVLETSLLKTEEQKRSIRQSKEMEKCQSEMQNGRGLSSICEEVRHQASSVNKMELKVQIPSDLKNNWLVEKVVYGISSEFLPLISVKETNNVQEDTEGRCQIKLTAQVNRAGDIAQAWVEVPEYNFELRNISMQGYNGLFPFSLRNGLTTRLMQDISRDQLPASCRIDSLVSTYDNKTYEYEMNECQHLLFKDCTSKGDLTPLAVLAKKQKGSDKKEVQIMSSRNIIELRPEQTSQSGGVSIKVDGEKISISSGTSYTKRSSQTGKIILRIYETQDQVVAVENPIEGFEVFFDGKKIEVVAPQYLHNRACGLCGDLNGENTADLKTPEQCIMSTPRLAAFSYMLEGAHCRGIPSEYRDQYEIEKRQCVQKRDVATPLKQLAKASFMNKLKQENLRHLVEVQKNQVCFSKEPVRSCPRSSRPEHVQSVDVRFTCMVRTYGKTQQYLKRINAGELISEVLSMPTSFTKRQVVPTKCEGLQQWGNEGSQWSQQQQQYHSQTAY